MPEPPRPPFLRQPAESPGARLRAALAAPGVTLAPGAADPLTARLIEEAGFAVVYATGAGISNVQLGMPDVGLATMDEVLRVVRAMAAVVALPILADADTGYGNPINVMRTIREFERAGVAGIQLEDQITPKRCGHFEGKEVIPAEEMVAKLRAARFARTDPETVIVARTDAAATHGLDEALRRARAYAEAGADAIFVEAPGSVEQMARITHDVAGIPHLANMVEGGKTPILPAATLSELGFSLALYANFPLRAAMHAVRQGLEHLHATGSSLGFEDRIVPWQERQAAVGLREVERLEHYFSGETL